MRSSGRFLLVTTLACGACAAMGPSPRICAPLESWSSPAYSCHLPPPPVAAPAPREPPPPPPPPPPPRAAVTAEKIEISEKVEFETDSSVIHKDSKGILDAVVQEMKSHPEIGKVRIEGHTDNRGTNEHNMTLSKERAKSVRDYLVSQGIDPKRLETEGYGETKPIADNGTDDGRYKNRRVEFVIVKKK
jgi:outer membrane protein OmpA-like peptidoglycan-associated protein